MWMEATQKVGVISEVLDVHSHRTKIIRTMTRVLRRAGWARLLEKREGAPTRMQKKTDPHTSPSAIFPGRGATTGGFESLDTVDLADTWIRAILMQSVPKFLHGVHRFAMRQAVKKGHEERNELMQIRGWKLFFFVPRLLFFRPKRGESSWRTEWPDVLLEKSLDSSMCGRIIALQKLDGAIRGSVVGDIFRRFVARTTAQQFRAKVEVATSPHQCALKTKAGCETVAHIAGTDGFRWRRHSRVGRQCGRI